MNRKAEIHELLSLSEEEILRRAGDHLFVCESLNHLYTKFANDILMRIQTNNKEGKPSVFILPVGPTGQYPILANLLNANQISLKNTHFFFMDEYCTDNGTALPDTHPLSFKKIMNELFFKHIQEDGRIPPSQVHFPNEDNITNLAHQIKSVGGIEVCYGGIGIHGHLAFNEPSLGIKDTQPRKVALNPYTITINAIRSHVGGNLEGFPSSAFTLGMSEILGAKQIRLYCRSGQDQDWAKTILRLALLGTPGDDYPVTYIRERNYKVITDRETLHPPTYIL